MKKGFTLAELLAVIVILGLLALIAVPVVLNKIKSTKEDLYNNQIEMKLNINDELIKLEYKGLLNIK